MDTFVNILEQHKEKIKANKAKTSRGELDTKYKQRVIITLILWLVAQLRFKLAKQCLHWSFGLVRWVWEPQRDVSVEN